MKLYRDTAKKRNAGYDSVLGVAFALRLDGLPFELRNSGCCDISAPISHADLHDPINSRSTVALATIAGLLAALVGEKVASAYNHAFRAIASFMEE